MDKSNKPEAPKLNSFYFSRLATLGDDHPEQKAQLENVYWGIINCSQHQKLEEVSKPAILAYTASKEQYDRVTASIASLKKMKGEGFDDKVEGLMTEAKALQEKVLVLVEELKDALEQTDNALEELEEIFLESEELQIQQSFEAAVNSLQEAGTYLQSEDRNKEKQELESFDESLEFLKKIEKKITEFSTLDDDSLDKLINDSEKAQQAATELGDDPAQNQKEPNNTALYVAGAAAATALIGGAVSASDDNKQQQEAQMRGQEPKKGLSFRTVALCVVGVVLAGFAGRELWKRSGKQSQKQVES